MYSFMVNLAESRALWEHIWELLLLNFQLRATLLG